MEILSWLYIFSNFKWTLIFCILKSEPKFKKFDLYQWAVDAYKSDHKGAQLADPLPRLIPETEAKELKPVAADKKGKNLKQGIN